MKHLLFFLRWAMYGTEPMMPYVQVQSTYSLDLFSLSPSPYVSKYLFLNPQHHSPSPISSAQVWYYNTSLSPPLVENLNTHTYCLGLVDIGCHLICVSAYECVSKSFIQLTFYPPPPLSLSNTHSHTHTLTHTHTHALWRARWTC